MRRLPIRVRVTAAFAVAMAIVLTGVGFLLYGRLSDDLASSLDQDLRLRAQDLSALVADPRASLTADSSSRLIERGESFAQVLAPDGRVLDTTRSLGHRPLLGGAELASALTGARFLNRPSVPGLDEGARLLALPVTRAGRSAVLVVGATRENAAETLRSLRSEMLIVGPVALVLAVLVGYVLAGYGLRAVEVMRRRAMAISAERPGERLPVPRTGDELERLGETLNAMLARIENTLQRERGLIAEAGHELRTPLALLRAELDYAVRYAETSDELRAALRTASSETDRLVQLAADLLLIASSDQGQLALRLELLDASEVLESVWQRFAWRAEAEGREVVIDCPAKLSLRADRVRIEQALGNLLENALRYGEGRITLTARSASGNVELAVRDEGSGFAPGFLDRAFERFSRADQSRSGPGAGLGLAIVSTIAAAHGGTVSAANRPEGGAEITISLPLGKPEQTSAAEGSSRSLTPG